MIGVGGVEILVACELWETWFVKIIIHCIEKKIYCDFKADDEMECLNYVFLRICQVFHT